MKNKKRLLLIIAALVVAIGASFAYWIMTFVQEGENVLSLECFELTFEESNDISLTKTYPMTDEEALKLTPYTFKIKNICTYTADYHVNIETIDETTTVSLNYLRVRLDNDNSFILGSKETNKEKTINEARDSRTIATGTLLTNEEKTYNLRLYFDNESSVEQTVQKKYQGKIVVISTLNKNNHVIALNLNGGSLSQNRVLGKVGEEIGELPTPTPEISKDIFNGWYSDSELTNKVDEHTIVTEELTNLYAKYDKTTSLIAGPEINRLWKTLAGNQNASNFTNDSNVTSIQRSTTKESEEHVISTNDDIYPVYTWFDNGKIYYYSDADVIYLNEDSSYLFKGLTKITTLDLSDFDSSNVINMNSMFENTAELENLDLRPFNTSNVTSMDHMFCSSKAKNFNFSNFNTSKVTNMAYMFFDADTTALDLSSFDTSKVTNMYSMFANCDSLESLNISSFDTSNVTTMEMMFKRNIKITSLNLSHFNTSNVEDMGEMFSNMTELISLNISSFDTTNVTDMSYMFSGVEKLSSLDLSSFNTSKLQNTMDMFSGMKALTTLDISSFDTSNVLYMGYMFKDCTELTKIYVGTDWSTERVSTSYGYGYTNLFTNDTNLVGGAGTTYDSTHTDKTYAHVDEGETNPGYFTLKTN